MAARSPGMQPPPVRTAGRPVLRGVCVALAVLFALAAATGAVVRAGEPGHHHHHASAAAATAVDIAVAHGKRSTPDVAVTDRPVVDAARPAARSTARSTATPAGLGAAPVRTRGPPATA